MANEYNKKFAPNPQLSASDIGTAADCIRRKVLQYNASSNSPLIFELSRYHLLITRRQTAAPGEGWVRILQGRNTPDDYFKRIVCGASDALVISIAPQALVDQKIEPWLKCGEIRDHKLSILTWLPSDPRCFDAEDPLVCACAKMLG